MNETIEKVLKYREEHFKVFDKMPIIYPVYSQEEHMELLHQPVVFEDKVFGMEILPNY